mgnify:CR=1 FL=1
MTIGIAENGPVTSGAGASAPAAGEPAAPRLPVPVGRVAPRPVLPARSPRVAEIIAAAEALLESEGPEALTMRRLGEALGIRAPSLYKHLPGKRAVEAALIDLALMEAGEVMHRVVDESGPHDVVYRLLAAYRSFARARPNLYRLATVGPPPWELLTPGVNEWAGEPFFRATGEPYLAQALWAAAHGTVILELDNRFPPGSDLDRTWAELAAAFTGSR